jgi:peptidoglycan/xylan/chitin deacetylase (PgdA/CDA1 family)
MIKRLFRKITGAKNKGAIAVMYHRIAKPVSDPWQIAVSPENFEQHLQVLKKNYHVISVPELIRQLKNKKIEKNSVCITFDDAYADNYLFAKPLLEKYELPATFFIATDYIGADKPFWWDELEAIILHSETLPLALSLHIGVESFKFNLAKEELSLEDKVKHRSWIWEETPPTLRCDLYLEIWKKLKPLKAIEIELILKELADWADYKRGFNAADVAMNNRQLKEMYTSSLFTIGVHTLSHPALAYHSENIQTHEIAACKNVLENLSGLKINTIAYPYGNYNDITLSVAANEQFSAGFTTQARLLDVSSNLLELGRLQVVNQEAKSFDKTLRRWLYS